MRMQALISVYLFLLLAAGCGRAISGEVDGRGLTLAHTSIDYYGDRYLLFTEKSMCPPSSGRWAQDMTVLYIPLPETGTLRVEATERDVDAVLLRECEHRASSVSGRLRIDRDEGEVVEGAVDVEFEHGALSGSFVAESFVVLEDCGHWPLDWGCYNDTEWWQIGGPDGPIRY